MFLLQHNLGEACAGFSSILDPNNLTIIKMWLLVTINKGLGALPALVFFTLLCAGNFYG